MIARDEADFLDRCLQSIAGLADEVVVVDTGSTDETPQVASRHGARLFHASWTGDFSEARNRCLAEAHGRWILVLDCDEVLARQDHEPLRRLLRSARADAYRLTTRNYTDSANQAGWVACRGTAPEERGHAGWFPTTKVRLWRRRPQVRFSGAVHELVEPSLLQAGLRLADCSVPVHHYGYAEKARPVARYVEAGERKARQSPDDLRARYELATAYRDAGRLAEALDQVEGVLAGLPAAAPEQRLYVEEEQVQLVRADLFARLGRLPQAVEVYEGLLRRFPRSFQAHNNLGLLRERQGRIQEARRHFARGARLAPDNPVLAGNLARLGGEGPAGPRLSVCLIVRDEEAVLERCLQSVAGVADEIVVVDTGSVDRTVEIARRCAARVGHFPWGDDFAAARNASLDLATGDWILWIDADEYLPAAQVEKVQRAAREPADHALYFTLVNEGSDGTRFQQVKMLPRREDLRFERPVHETVLPALRRAGVPVRFTDVEVHHTGYARPEDTARKQARYLGLMEAWLQGHPEDHQVRFRIGHTHYLSGEHHRARECFALLRRVPGQDCEARHARRLAALFTGRSLLEEGDCAAAVPALEEALGAAPDDALALLSLGDARGKLGQHQAAVDLLQRSLQGRVDPFFPLDERLVRYSAHFFLGTCLLALGQGGPARAALAAACRVLPDRAEAPAALAQLAPAPAGQGRLSLCMIARNEEERLGRCLASAADVVDEIVVVDTGSSDRTLEVAAHYGARLGHFPWCDDFARARNASLYLATGDWILWLDPDDLLPAEEHPRIRQLLQGPRDRAYFFVLDDQGYEHVSCLQLRLFPNLPGVVFEMPVHEQVTPSLARLGVQTVPTQIRVLHTGYTTPEVVRAKKDRYLGIMERWLEEHPDDYIVRSHVALTYHTTGRLDEAEDAYLRIVYESRCLGDRNYVVYTTALLFLGRTYLRKGELPAALAQLRRAEAVDPDYVLTGLSLAEVLLRQGEATQALAYARRVLAAGRQITFFPVDQPEIEYSAQVLCGQALQALGEVEAAEQAYRQAASVPVSRRSEALGSLAELYRGRGDRAAALHVLEEAQRLDPENAKHLFNAGVLHLEGRDLAAATAAFEAVLARTPDHLPALLNLGFAAKAGGQPDRAEAIYRRALAADPGGVEARANLAHLLLDAQRHAEARALFAAVREKQPGLLDIELGYVATLCQAGQWQAVADAVRAAAASLGGVELELTTPSGLAGTLVRLAAPLVRAGQTRCALLALTAAVLADPASAPARRALAEVHYAGRDYWKAVAQLEAILTAAPQDRDAFRRLGDCYQALGVQEAARLCYQHSGLL
ncbi:MAG: glycosyltransferase [Candidatus Latescibacterota bacterium]